MIYERYESFNVTIYWPIVWPAKVYRPERVSALIGQYVHPSCDI